MSESERHLQREELDRGDVSGCNEAGLCEAFVDGGGEGGGRLHRGKTCVGRGVGRPGPRSRMRAARCALRGVGDGEGGDRAAAARGRQGTWRGRGRSMSAGCGTRWSRMRCRRAAWRCPRCLARRRSERQRVPGHPWRISCRAAAHDDAEPAGRHGESRGGFSDHVSRVPGRAKVAHDGDAVRGGPLLLAVAYVDGVLVEEVAELRVQPGQVEGGLWGIVL